MSVPMEYSLLICFKPGFFKADYLDDILAECLTREIRVNAIDKDKIIEIIPETADLLAPYSTVILATSYDRNAISMYKQYLYSDKQDAKVYFLERE